MCILRPLLDKNTMATNEESQQSGPAQNADENPQPTSPATEVVEESPSEISLEEFEKLKKQAAKADENWNQLLRVSADFDNYKKRAARERQEAIKFANENLLEKLIPVLDNFEMALLAANDPKGGTVEALKTGVSMIYGQLKSVAIDSGLEEIDATNKPFDPNWHEAVSHQESDSAAEGHVLQQLRRGYKLRDRLLRPATVVVAKKASA